MTTRTIRRLLVLGLLVTACGPAGPEGVPSESSLEVVAAGPTLYRVLEDGVPVASFPVESTNLDTVEADRDPATGHVIAALRHGEHGGASLILADGARTVELLRTGRTVSLSRPRWSPDGSRFAFVLALAPRWLEPDQAGGTPRLQLQGELWIGDPSGRTTRLGATSDAARVVGWTDEQTLLYTRYAPGDLPQEGLASCDLGRGETRDLVPNRGDANVYNFALVGRHIAFVRTSAAISTQPRHDDTAEVVLASLDGAPPRVVAREQGAMPVDLALRGGKLSYAVEGAALARIVDLDTERSATEARPIHHLTLPSKGMLLTSLSMPYVHQVYDTPDGFNGNWACGPTSTLMAILHFGRLKAWPVSVSIPSKHTSDYGAYVAYKYTAYNYTFNRMQTDASGKAAYGAYGHCTENGGAWAWRMQDYAKKHDLKSDFTSSATFADVKNQINNGKVVVLSTQLTSAGHIITVKGYTADGKLVVNDPYGNKALGTYPNYKGGDITYSWSYVSAKWNITVYGTPTEPEPTYKATVVEVAYPQTMVAGSQAKATVKYTNAGTASWDANTRLGTTEPRDRESSFYTSTDWVAKNRAAAAAATKPGGAATFSFTLTAPAVKTSTDYVECFNLLQEKVTWFSAPGDKQVCLKIHVTPAAALVEAPVVSALVQPALDPDATHGHGNPGTPDPQPTTEGGCAVAPLAPAGPWALVPLLGLALLRRRPR